MMHSTPQAGLKWALEYHIVGSLAMEAEENATRVTIGIVVISVLAGIHLIFVGALGSVSVNKKWPKVVAGVRS